MILFGIINKNKFSFILVLCSALLTSVAIAVLSTPIFRSEALLAPVESKDNSGFDGLYRQLGGIADLAGISIRSNSNINETMAILKSREFISKFIIDKKLIDELFHKDWDESNQRWKENIKPPSVLRAYEKFVNSILRINIDKKTGLVTLAIEWVDPKLAQNWATEIIDRINRQLREEAIINAEKSIEYLQSELDSTSVIEVKQSIYNLIEAQTKNKMIANTQHDYAFRVLDKAVVPESKIKPRKKLIILFGGLLGIMLGVIFSILKHLYRNRINV